MKTCNERPLTSRPTVRPGSPWSFPQCLVETLPTGLTVVRVPMPGQRIVTMEIGLDAPLCTEPAGLEGLAGLVVRTADESTGPIPAQLSLRPWSRSEPATTDRPGWPEVTSASMCP